MPDTVNAPVAFRRKDRVVAREDLPGVPAGTPGRVFTAVGLSWLRYRVRFDNGVELGSLGAERLARPGDEGIPEVDEPDRFEPFAVASLIFSLTTLVIGSAAGVLFGHAALNRLTTRPRRGRALAVAGLVLGYAGLATAFFWITYAATN